MKMLVWKKHLYLEILKTFFLFLISFYLLYVLMDYSIHAQHFSKSGLPSFYTLALYYLCHFSKRLEILLPLAFLVSFLKILLQMNQKNELIALFTSGLTKKQFLKPFYFCSFIIAFFLYLNFEYCVFLSLNYLENFESQNFKSKNLEKLETPSAYFLPTKGMGYLLFQSCKDKIFQDVYYIESFDTIFRIKRLDSSCFPYQAEWVEHYQRKEGKIELINTFKNQIFKDLELDFSFRKQSQIPYEHRPLSELFSLLFLETKNSENEASLKTHFYFKLLVPLVPILFFFIISPFCLTFSRKTPIFLLYALSLFGFIAFFILLDGAIILGENKVISSIIAISTPFVLAFFAGACQYSFSRYK